MTQSLSVPLRRAGFWRRIIAQLIDALFVYIPIQIVVAFLFIQTSGYIQMSKGFGYYGTCKPASLIAPNTALLIPKEFNYSEICKIYAFGAQTAEILKIGAQNEQGSNATLKIGAYLLDKDGQPVEGYLIDLYVYATYILYCVILPSLCGKTLGRHVVFTKLIDLSNPNKRGVPLRKMITRYLAMFIGAIPWSIITGTYFFPVFGGSEVTIPFLSSAINWNTAGAAIFAIWGLANLVQIVRRTDTIYDRIAGTAVIET